LVHVSLSPNGISVDSAVVAWLAYTDKQTDRPRYVNTSVAVAHI